MSSSDQRSNGAFEPTSANRVMDAFGQSSGASRAKVLHVTGWGRSGSTIFGNVLNSLPNYVHLGEVIWLWDHGLVQQDPCGCGRSLPDCPLWSPVLRAMSDVAEYPRRVIRRRDAAGGHKRMALGQLHHDPAYLEVLDRLYSALASSADAEVIVDSSKLPLYAHALSRVPSVDLFVLHLVRDPRACAYSWQKRVTRRDSTAHRPMQRHSVVKNAVAWLGWNALSERLGGRYLRVRYEDFVRDPDRIAHLVHDFVGVDAEELQRDQMGALRLEPSHAVWGNPVRSQGTGAVTLKIDAEWKERLPRYAQALTTSITFPLMARYGYLAR